jgi:hypothetical protein
VRGRPAGISKRPALWAALVAIILLAAGGFWYFSSLLNHASGLLKGVASADPRRSYSGPFLNVDPAVRYVSDERCGDCHRDKAVSYAEHPMGRALLPVAQTTPPAGDKRSNNPFQAFSSRFSVEQEDGRIWHRRTWLAPKGRPAPEMKWAVQYALGSGTHGFGYLTDRDGYLFETPISWYSEKQIYDVSPGFGQAFSLTGRAILSECLFCHANRANHIEGSVNRYREPVFDGYAIGCQRCHGPGELHVARRDKNEELPGEDYTIVNPGRLEPALREAVCEQCHLQGKERVLPRGRELYDFRPGLPLGLFWSVFVPSADSKEEQKAVGHVEQMYESRCFQGSAGPEQLGCISCHDPHQHVRPAERIAHYRDRCLQCHGKRGCSVPLAERLARPTGDSCIDCHMSRYGSSDIPHAASTNHRILRTRPPGPAAMNKEHAPASRGGLPVVSFYPNRTETGANERDRALALVKLARSGDSAALRVLDRVLTLLEPALKDDPTDLPVIEGRGYALALQGRWPEALAAFEAVVARAPDHELGLRGAATAAEALHQTEAADGYWQRAIAVDPWEPRYRRQLALLRVKRQAWTEAAPECEAWARLDPFSAEAHTARVQCLLAAGNKAGARTAFELVEMLAPPNLRELQLRFEKKLR